MVPLQLLQLQLLLVAFEHFHLLLELHLGLVEVLQFLLLLLEGGEPLFILQLFLLSIIESKHVPHGDIPVVDRASDSSPFDCLV